MLTQRSFPLFLCAAFWAGAPSCVQAQSLSASTPTQISVGLGNTQANAKSEDIAVSPNSGIVAFRSDASNVVADDTNGVSDIFVRAANGSITRQSVSSAGEQSNGQSASPVLSQVTASGAYGLAFLSRSTNFVSGLSTQDGGFDQVYLRLPHIQKTILISQGYAESGIVGAAGTSSHLQVVALNNGATFLVAFQSDAFNLVRDAVPPFDSSIGRRLTRIFVATVSIDGTDAKLVKMQEFVGLNDVQADGDLQEPVLSGNGERILFRTNAKNLGWENPSGAYNIALKTKGGGLSLVSKSPVDGAAGTSFSDSAAISFSGSRYVFRTLAPNIFDASGDSPALVLYSEDTKEYTLVNTDENGVRGNSTVVEGVSMDPQGRLVTFVDYSSNYLPAGADTNSVHDVFVKDLTSKKIVRVNVGAGGVQETDGSRGGEVLGTLGYNTQTATVGFFSAGAPLRQVGSGIESEVYRSLITFSAPTLDSNTKLEAPPDVVSGVKRLTLTLQKFATSAKVSSRNTVEAQATKVSYEVQLTNTTKKKKLKVVSTRNRVVLRNLTPGQYTVRYRVVGTPSKGKKITTKFSPPANATVKAK